MRAVSTRAIELQNGWSALLVGALLLYPSATFQTAASYQFFAAYGDEWTWGLVFLALGVAQLLAAGRMSLNTLAQTGEAPLFINASGEAFPLRIDGFTLHTSAGASVGYMHLRGGPGSGTTFKVQLFADS